MKNTLLETARAARRCRVVLCVVSLALLPAVLALTAPGILQAQAREGTSAVLRTPRWLHVSATQRTRYEHLWNPFIPAIVSNDMALALRTTLLVELPTDPVSLGIELADSRVYLRDEAAPVNVSAVNPLDILQAYVTADLPDILVDGTSLRVRIGRQTMDIGSRRLVARNRFRNAINAFGGLSVEWTNRNHDNVTAFFAFPVERRIDSTSDNGMRLDLERWETVFWGISFALRPQRNSVAAELNLMGIHERDSEDCATTNRRFLAPGLRLYRDPEPGRLDFELEGVIEKGLSRLTALPEDTTDRHHFAFFLHASLGHTFGAEWHPRLLLQYDYASGDQDPSDDANGRFDTLFGARRFEFGPTGIYGALARSNINSPGARVELQPHRTLHGFLAYRATWLAQARDGWTAAQIRDEAGNSGTFVGHQIEASVRWTILPDNMRLEAGVAHLWLGGFPKSAPNGNAGVRDPTYAYTQLSLQI